MLNGTQFSELESRLKIAEDSAEREAILREARLLSLEGDHLFQESTNFHIHVNPDFTSLQAPERAVLMALRDGVEAVQVANFADPLAFNRGFGRYALAAGVTPSASTEMLALPDGELMEALQGKFGTPGSKLKINDKTPERIYVIVAGFNPSDISNLVLPDKYSTLLAEKRRAIHQRTLEILGNLDQYMKATVDYGISEEWKEKITGSVDFFQERWIAQAAYESIVQRSSDIGADIKKLGLAYDGDFAQDVAGAQGAIRDSLFKKDGHPAYASQSDKEFFSLDEVFGLAREIDGFVKLPMVYAGPDNNPYSDVDQTPERFSSFIDFMGDRGYPIYSFQAITVRNTDDELRPFMMHFGGSDFIFDFGTEHNDRKERPLTPLWKDGSEISSDLWQIANQAAYVQIAHAYGGDSCKFVDAIGERTTASPDYLESVGRGIAQDLQKRLLITE